MNIRITATYPATDGSMPESVEVDWTDIPDAAPSGTLVSLWIGHLMRVPGRGDSGEGRRLLEYALHLRMNGERAPGGNETWDEFDRRCETYLRHMQ